MRKTSKEQDEFLIPSPGVEARAMVVALPFVGIQADSC
jgi:hypothetical protein